MASCTRQENILGGGGVSAVVGGDVGAAVVGEDVGEEEGERVGAREGESVGAKVGEAVRIGIPLSFINRRAVVGNTAESASRADRRQAILMLEKNNDD
jgi:hypothetical protein